MKTVSGMGRFLPKNKELKNKAEHVNTTDLQTGG